MGRTKSYENIVKPHLAKIIKWRKEGAEIDWIAEQFPVSRSTFYKWKAQNKDFSDAIKEAEETCYENMALTAENTLYKKLKDRMATVEETVEQWTDKNGKVIKQHKVIKKRLVQANITAIIFALKNTDPKRWNDRSQVELTGNLKVDNPFQNLTEDELRKLANQDE